MKRIVQTPATLLAIIAFFMLSCTGTSSAQGGMEASTTKSSEAMQESPENGEPQENLDYMVGSWSSPVTKEEVKQITSMLDFWGDATKAKYKHDAFTNIWVVNLKDHHDWRIDVAEIDASQKVTGPTEIFTKEQLALVANANYSDHLRFSAFFNSTNYATGEVEENVLVSQSVCVVPDVQATYKGGMDGVVSYLKKASKGQVKHVKKDEVGTCKVYFTVTDKGSIANVKLVASSNYSDVDQALINIVKDMPKKWTPARDNKGEKVDQEFVFTFGRGGC